MLKRIAAFAAVAAVSACAGRSPNPVAVVQTKDQFMDCTAVQAESRANAQTISELSGEQGSKVAQNVAAGVIGLLIWPVWFGMDFQDAAGQEKVALDHRNEYLGQLALQRCQPGVAQTTLFATSQPGAVRPSGTPAQQEAECRNAALAANTNELFVSLYDRCMGLRP